MAETTHQRNDDGTYRQIVTPARLRQILTDDGDSFDRPDWMTDKDEWNVTDELYDSSTNRTCFLYDSDTNDSLSADDLGITKDEYRETVAESLACDQAEGHVRVGDRRVYAAE